MRGDATLRMQATHGAPHRIIAQADARCANDRA
jgi:hypothetical protein